MSSLEKRVANRQNARKSTGPRTEAGKRRSSRNALSAGFFAYETLIPGDDAHLFVALRKALYRDLQPEGAMEILLVDNVVSASWRLRRLMRVESGLLTRGFRDQDSIDERTARAFFREEDSLQKLTRYESALNRSLYRAYHELERRQAVRMGQEVAPPTILDIEAQPATSCAG
jgi:hypothetical protein